MRKEINESKRYSKGITLIALVVTIVVLLILAGVTISTLFGDNGIITAAKKAAEDTKTAEDSVGDALNDLADEMQDQINGTIKSAEEYLTDIRANLSAYRSKAQALGQTTDQNIGIGTDGKVANLDLWYYVKTDDGTGISLGNEESSDKNYGYKPENIVNGRIQGKVPQYIYITTEDKIYPITSMKGTFNYWYRLWDSSDSSYSSLKYAPEIPNTVKEMSYTFCNCTELITGPIIPLGVTNINYIFYLCSSLTTAPTIPSGVTNMEGTFSGCTSLTTAPEIPSSVTNMNSTFDSCTGLTTGPTIPSGVTNMEGTFSGCTSLTTSPTIPSSVTSMSYTFKKCTSLITAPIIPSSVTNMEGTFSGCTSLTTAPKTPSSVTNMWSTFSDCTSLTTAPEIPSSVTSMGYIFKECTKLQGDLVINANPTSYEGCLYNAGKDATSKLYLTGSSTMLNTLLNTKGNSTNIAIK